MREKLPMQIVPMVELGITPACAGKTICYNIVCSNFWDHPRVCGKNLNVKSVACSTGGSPPRVREKLVIQDIAHDIAGITPACAGKTVI